MEGDWHTSSHTHAIQTEAKGFAPWGPGQGAPSQPLPSKVAWGVETHACLPAEPWEKVSPAGAALVVGAGPPLVPLPGGPAQPSLPAWVPAAPATEQ